MNFTSFLCNCSYSIFPEDLNSSVSIVSNSGTVEQGFGARYLLKTIMVDVKSVVDAMPSKLPVKSILSGHPSNVINLPFVQGS